MHLGRGQSGRSGRVIGPGEGGLAHMRDVEEAGGGPGMEVFGEDACGDLEAGHPRAVRGLEEADLREVLGDVAETAGMLGEAANVTVTSIMPEASGSALGFDRLVMLATGAQRVDDVIWTPVAGGDY